MKANWDLCKIQGSHSDLLTRHCHLVVVPDVLKPLHSFEMSGTIFPVGQKTTTFQLRCSLILLFLLIDCKIFIAKCEYFAVHSCVVAIFM